MGISDRITRIARSYLRSTQEKVGEEWDELSQKFSDGELGEDLLNKLKSFRQKKPEGEDLSDEEILQILEEDEDPIVQGGQERTRVRSRSRKQEKALHDAYKKLGLKSSASMDAVEKAFKKEMLKFHPDRFANEPEKLESATKVSQILSEAYNLIKAEQG